MTDLRQAAQMALEALESRGSTRELHHHVITTLRAAIRQQAEPILTHRITSWGHCGVCRHDRIPGEGCARQECPDSPQQQAEPVAWTPVAEALPKSGVKVLACYRNRLGNLRRIRAMWTAAKTEEADSDDAEACSEYDEATDTHYVTEGWYECIDNWGEYSSVAVTEGEVTHWMPLPHDPYTAPPQRKPLSDEEIGRAWSVVNGEHNASASVKRRITRAIEAAYGIKEGT